MILTVFSPEKSLHVTHVKVITLMLCDSLHAKFLTQSWFDNYAAFFICTQVGQASDSDD